MIFCALAARSARWPSDMSSLIADYCPMLNVFGQDWQHCCGGSAVTPSGQCEAGFPPGSLPQETRELWPISGKFGPWICFR